MPRRRSDPVRCVMQGFCKNILDVADNLDRALESVPGNVLDAAADGGAGIVGSAGDGDAADSDAEGAVTCSLVAKNLCSLHGGVAMSQKARPPRRPLHSPGVLVSF